MLFALWEIYNLPALLEDLKADLDTLDNPLSLSDNNRTRELILEDGCAQFKASFKDILWCLGERPTALGFALDRALPTHAFAQVW